MERTRFEYEVTIYPEESFHELVYYCTSTGECSADKAPVEMTRVLGQVLNDRGREGWELVQITFSSAGVVGFWKRALQ